MPDGVRPPAQGPIHLGQQKLGLSLIGRSLIQDPQLHQRSLQLPPRSQHLRLLEPRHHRPRRHLARPRILRQRGGGILQLLEHAADTGDEDRVGGVDARRGAVVLLRRLPLALSLVDLAEAVPGVVVAVVGADGGAVGRFGLVELLVGDVLVALQREGVGEARVQLGGALEAFEGLVVAALQGEGVADGDPGGGRQAVGVEEGVGQVGKVDGAFQVPERGRVEFHVFEAGGGHGADAREAFLGFGVVGLLVEGAAHLGENPGRFALLGWDGVEDLEGVLALVMAQGEVAAAEAL